jgi:hypothetical protein
MSENSPSSRASSPINILDSYCKSAPSEQNAVDIFQGEWASAFPPPYQDLKAGGIPLFQDGRTAWALNILGGVRGQNVLELGPLEGGHSFMLERAGAATVTAIESNTRAYLKCLVAKEILNLARVRFLCGDFTPYLQNSRQHFDLVVASGVLYHMKDPLQLLKLIADHTDRLFMWTHYYDPEIINSKSYLKSKFVSQQSIPLGDQTVQLHRHEYQTMLAEKSFCGGTESYSTWLTRDSLLHALRTYGFTTFEFHGETPDHPHGPALSLVATKA